MARKIRLREFIPKNTDIILFDTNVLIDLFFPISFGKEIGQIVDLYHKILKSGAKIIISSIQISEFVNKCIRIQFELYKKENEDCLDFKKGYRITEDYRDSMNMIIDIIRNEWKQKFIFIDDKFSSLGFDNIFRYNFSYDFNDALLVEIANANQAIIVTNDRDIINYSVKQPIVTSNEFILTYS